MRFNPDPKTIDKACRQGFRKPISLITDRQKRNRSKKCSDRRFFKRCVFCGSARNIRIHHLNGNEADYTSGNMVPACHAHNVKLGYILKKKGIGRRVDLEYKKNPDEVKPARNLAQWMMAVKALHGESSDMTTRQAIAMIRATSPRRRSDFASDIWKIRRAKGTDKTAAPF